MACTADIISCSLYQTAGRSLTAPSMAGSNEGALRVVEELVDLERKSGKR